MTGASQLFFLAVDHRRSFERLFEIDEPVGERDHEQLTAAKALIVEALGDVAAQRADIARTGGLGILIDDRYGAAAIVAARHRGFAVALAFERSGQAVLEFEHDDWRERLTADPPDFVKVLIRHRADGAAADVARQLDRLVQISSACATSPAAFLLELLVPFSDSERDGSTPEDLEQRVRPRLVVEAIRQIQEAGVEPGVWKVEGVADSTGCATIAAAARRDGRDGTGVVVLGAGAKTETVNRWLEAAAGGGYSGFAVGRSIWADAILAHRRGELDAASARTRIADRYCTFIDAFRAAPEPAV